MATVMNIDEVSNYFKNTVYSFATMGKDEADTAKVKESFPLADGVDGKDVIIKVQKTCGNCTEARYNPESNSVDVEVEISKMGGYGSRAILTSIVNVHVKHPKEGENGEDTVYVAKDEYIVDPETKIQSPNPDYNSVIQLKVTGSVQY